MIGVAALAVAGCSDSTKQHLAACKLQAIEEYPLEGAFKENASASLKTKSFLVR